MYWCVITCLEVCLRVVYSFEAFMIIYYSYFFHPPILLLLLLILHHHHHFKFQRFLQQTLQIDRPKSFISYSNSSGSGLILTPSYHLSLHIFTSFAMSTISLVNSFSFPNASPFASAASAAASSHFPATRSSRTPASSPRTAAAPPIPP